VYPNGLQCSDFNDEVYFENNADMIPGGTLYMHYMYLGKLKCKRGAVESGEPL